MEKIRNFFFKNQTRKQTFAKNTSWLFVGEMASRLLKMGLIFYAARVIGVTGWGGFSYAMSLASICCFFSDAGLGSLVTREYAKDDSHTTYITNAFFLKIAFITFSFLVVLIASPIFARGAATIGLILLVGAFILIDSLKDFSISVARAQQRMEIDAYMKIGTTILITGIGFVFLYFRPHALSLALAYVIGSAIALVFILPSFIPHVKNTKLLDKKILKLIFWDNLFLGILLFTNALMLNEDTVIVGMLKGSYSAGLYAAAQKIIQAVYIIPAVITTSLLPVLSKQALHKETFDLLYEKIVIFLFLLAIPISIGGSLLSKPLITLLYGASYAGAAPALSILFFCVLAIFPSLFIIDSALSLNRHRELIKINITANVVNVLANYFLVKHFGITGAATASLITLSFVTIWMLCFFKQVNFLSWKMTLLKIIFATAVMTGSVLVLRMLNVSLFINAIISGALYLGILFITKEKITREYIWKTFTSSQ